MSYINTLILLLAKWHFKRAANKHLKKYENLRAFYVSDENLDRALSFHEVGFHHHQYQNNLEILNLINENESTIIGFK